MVKRPIGRDYAELVEPAIRVMLLIQYWVGASCPAGKMQRGPAATEKVARGPQPCSSGFGGNGVRTVIVEDPPKGVATWHGNASSYLRNFDLALVILTRPVFC